MRIALVVGINYYEHGSKLFGCVNDAYSVKTILDRHDGGSVNFDCMLLTGTGPKDRVDRGDLSRTELRNYSIIRPILPCSILPGMGILRRQAGIS